MHVYLAISLLCHLNSANNWKSPFPLDLILATPTFLTSSKESLAGIPVETARDSSFITDLCM